MGGQTTTGDGPFKALGRPGLARITGFVETLKEDEKKEARRCVVDALNSKATEQELVAMAGVTPETDPDFHKSLKRMQEDPDGAIVLKRLRRWLVLRIGEQLGCQMELYWHKGTYVLELNNGLAIIRVPENAFCVSEDGKTDVVFLDNREPKAVSTSPK
jgi:hypothetical protein